MGTLGELAVVAAALVVSVVIWSALQAGKKKRADRDSGDSGSHLHDDHRQPADDRDIGDSGDS
ncbi:MAG: hypothetical protein WCY15_15525 [Phenylobacterium sp.]|jgi:hypothetical protein|uniref:hypothetical protein n=1 Tax=Phenylobacterium sp. TaxID=1871053 RepID=UPI002A36FE2A|nr:hypothetical protein [Phenylobacterium sp.]MDX9998985.1 hypothetical protein [Phenylobacterium sp.]